MNKKFIYFLIILAQASFIGAIVIFSVWNKNTYKQEKLIKHEIKKLHDTTALKMYKYPSGETGSLRYDWETGEKGELIRY